MNREYKVVASREIEELEHIVNAHVQKGWEVKGGISIDRFGAYFQSLFIEEQEPVVERVEVLPGHVKKLHYSDGSVTTITPNTVGENR